MRMPTDPSRARPLLPSLTFTAALLAAVACSSSSSSPGNAGADSGPGYGGSADGGAGGAGGDASREAAAMACTSTSLPVDTYMPNIAKNGKNGAYTFLLASTEPAPPAAGMNTWTVRVLDAQSGQPVTGEKMSLPTSTPLFNYPHDPLMPEHGTGTSVTPTIHDNGDGTSTIVMDLANPGVWWVFVEAQDGTTVDGSQFAFCLE